MTALSLGLTATRFGDDNSPFLSARRVAEQLGVTLSELAKLIGVARNTLAAKSSAPCASTPSTRRPSTRSTTRARPARASARVARTSREWI